MGLWERHFASDAVKCGWKAIPNHPQAFVKDNIRNGQRMMLLTYVDDKVICGQGSNSEVSLLSKHLELTPAEPLLLMLGVQLHFEEKK